MKDTDKIYEFAKYNGALHPVNSHAHDIINNLSDGEITAILLNNKRDLNLHRAYFALLNYIYSYLPKQFKNKVPSEKFYIFLKYQNDQLTEIFRFKDGKTIYEPISISFAKMDEVQFKAFVNTQLPLIYEKLINVFFEPETAKQIIEKIETEFEKILSKFIAP